MPRQKTYTWEQIEEAQRLRRQGFSFSKIAEDVGMRESSVIAYTRTIRPGGNHIERRTIGDILGVLKPGQPFMELPLPSGLLGLWEEEIALQEKEKQDSD